MSIGFIFASVRILFLLFLTQTKELSCLSSSIFGCYYFGFQAFGASLRPKWMVGLNRTEIIESKAKPFTFSQQVN